MYKNYLKIYEEYGEDSTLHFGGDIIPISKLSDDEITVWISKFKGIRSVSIEYLYYILTDVLNKRIIKNRIEKINKIKNLSLNYDNK